MEERLEALEKKVAHLESVLNSLQAKSLLPNHLQQHVPSTEEFESLKVLLESKQWPEAIPQSLLCPDNDAEKTKRAENILDLLIDLPLEGLRFLDFGCGEGHVLQQAKRQNPRVMVGYDITEHEKWQSFPSHEKIHYTTSWDELVNLGPYNVVLMYDVLDHMGEWQDIVNTLVKIKQNMIRGGRLYMRCHPWCSRHATHLYHKINKAYIHLVFTEDELAEMGYATDHKFRCIHPMAQYQDIFNRSGFRIFRRGNTVQQGAEKFFTDTPVIARRIKQNWGDSQNPALKNGTMFPTQQVAMQFVDFVLVPK